MRQKAEFICQYESYDLEGWEGGLAVCGMTVPHGGKVIAIPRLGLSTCIVGDNKSYYVHDMLSNNRTLYHDRKSFETLERLIMRDFCA